MLLRLSYKMIAVEFKCLGARSMFAFTRYRFFKYIYIKLLVVMANEETVRKWVLGISYFVLFTGFVPCIFQTYRYAVDYKENLPINRGLMFMSLFSYSPVMILVVSIIVTSMSKRRFGLIGILTMFIGIGWYWWFIKSLPNEL